MTDIQILYEFRPGMRGSVACSDVVHEVAELGRLHAKCLCERANV